MSNDTEHFQPEPNIQFYDAATQKEMMLADFHGEPAWLFYKHVDGQWVSLRKATTDDVMKIVDAHCVKP